MIATIHRPYFLPWMGYFSKLFYSDIFIVMDDVNFTKRHFIDRTKIINPQGEEMWLSLRTGENYNKKCNEIILPHCFCPDDIMKTLAHSYSKARFYKTYQTDIETILNESFLYSKELHKFNIKIVESIMHLLNLNIPTIFWESQFSTVSDPTERLIMLCKQTNSTHLILGSGGSTEKHEINKIKSQGIHLLYQDFYGNHPIYYQTRRTKIGFAKGLSIVDCLFNEGIDITRNLITDRNNKPYEI